jgi:ABC-2 type transport system ATP-binding protein
MRQPGVDVTEAVTAESLEKSYGGGTRALDGLSFAVEQATVFGLLGPNGAGKTTAIKVLTTTLLPDAGRATVLGFDVVRDADEVRRLIGLAGQYAAVDENLTGEENLRMIGYLNHLSRREVKARAGELLERFDLVNAAKRPLKTYSGGMRRRLDIAASLVAHPSVLFLDEPTTGLDPQSRNDLWQVIEELVDSGTTVLLTTQYLEEADRLANRIAVVDHGRVIAEGTPSQLKAEMGTTVLEITLIDAASAARAADLLGSLPTKAPSVVGSTVEVPVTDGSKLPMQALRLLDQEGIQPLFFSLRQPSLDDVFLALTGRRATGQDAA